MVIMLAALAVNAAATGTVAQAENDVVDAMGEAKLIPADAFMTGNVQDILHIDGVSVTVRPDGDAYALIFTNDTDEVRPVHVAVQASETTGSMFSRIMPMPRELTQIVIEDEIPIGAKLTRRIGGGIYGETAGAVAVLTPPDALLAELTTALPNDNLMMGDFVTHSFQFLPLTGPEDVAIGALRVDATYQTAEPVEGRVDKVVKEVQEVSESLLLQLIATK